MTINSELFENHFTCTWRKLLLTDSLLSESPTHLITFTIQPNQRLTPAVLTQSNLWVDPTHVHVCGDHELYHTDDDLHYCGLLCFHLCLSVCLFIFAITWKQLIMFFSNLVHCYYNTYVNTYLFYVRSEFNVTGSFYAPLKAYAWI